MQVSLMAKIWRVTLVIVALVATSGLKAQTGSPPGGSTGRASADSAAAVGAAVAWIALLDSNQLQASLDSAAPLFRSMIRTPIALANFLAQARPNIRSAERKVVQFEWDPDLPSAPADRYARVVFQVATNKGSAIETVIVARTATGWRTAMYAARGGQ